MVVSVWWNIKWFFSFVFNHFLVSRVKSKVILFKEIFLYSMDLIEVATDLV